jgi:ABC-type bacteriocin/lantibiotic exporter with double-glycine peptidase domain
MIKTINKLLFLLTLKEQRKALILLMMIIIMAILDVAGVASIMPFMAVVSNPDIIKSNAFLARSYSLLGFEKPHDFMFFLGIVVIVTLVLSLTFKAITTYAQLRFSLMREYTIGKRLIESYLNQPYTWFLNKHSANLGNTILTEVNQVMGSAMAPMMNVIAQGLLSLALLALLITMNPMLALIVGAVLGMTYAIIYYLMRNPLYRIGLDRVKASEERYKAVNEAFSGIKEIKIGGLENRYVDKFAKPAELFAKSHALIQVIVQIPRFAVEAVAFVGMLMVVLYLMSGSGDFASGLPIVALYSLAGYRLMPALQLTYASVVQLRSASKALDLLFNDVRNLPSFSLKNQDDQTLTINDKVVLKSIHFTYPFAEKPSLKNIDLEIKRNHIIGLVGASGGGKTTIVDIILGLLEPDSGTISVDGTEINSSNQHSWQKCIGYVPQHIFLTDDTVAGNIAFGIEPDKIDMAAVEVAARIANLHHFVLEELPLGYNTAVGERGVRLSGGQRQRIGIARALYHNPQLLILDEATSALDNITEQAVMKAVNNLGGNITIIIIAHRLTTVRACDQIYMMLEGQIMANGTYGELLKYNESFRGMAAY